MLKFMIFLLFVSSACFAAENQLDVQVGGGFPLTSVSLGGGSDKAGTHALEISADALHPINDRFYLGIRGSYFNSGDNDSETLVPAALSPIASKITALLAMARVDLMPHARCVPYVIAGLGLTRNSLTITSEPRAGFTWPDTGTTESRTLVSDTKNGLGFAGGLGMDYAICDHFFMGAEALFQGSSRETFALTPQGQTVTGSSSLNTALNILNIGVKAGIKF